ncbi:GGDEF domain-containing protein [Paracoccus caeni]|uniref:diguanylate cyclase n=1 Tax=Paracoccus caeni TaxID=657651 RepID=A0A934SCR2_9RHOB|nr:GGDEF domain-containing protein [Paracoccus caeni]MBK4215517.1 GGDEF domain-containing protein [Paracoccus caeni]
MDGTTDIRIADRAVIEQLLPMHLHLAADGTVIGIGPTLRKMIGAATGPVEALFRDARPGVTEELSATIRRAAGQGERLFLRMIDPPMLSLRGHAVETADGSLLVDLGFGIALIDAVNAAGLTDSDFAPPELAMELLFLYEANRAVLGELSSFNHQLEEARRAAEVKAHTDPLTGLSNRRGLDIALSLAFHAAFDPQNADDRKAFALVHLDLDKFKQVNDTLGHEAGDRVLCDVGCVLRETTRSHDVAARIGGDEFVLILPGLQSAPTLEKLSRRIIDGIEAVRVTADGGSAVSASIGIVLSDGYRGLTPEQMLRDADTALYRSKNAGRRRATILQKPLV